ncbi:hypothetical protein PILCRDRAFT_368949 [Piloderma croceum F 1598]|uniref:Uncharacterized protein n=1 Tax=Piloderma croceum (strain F 1598) TaxID=765440 RepID=A0A0C3G2E3_PILCF|nr:hypothetical protein PILCRDRAFT_368949 [Piloderma croceum F 1598]
MDSLPCRVHHMLKPPGHDGCIHIPRSNIVFLSSRNKLCYVRPFAPLLFLVVVLPSKL